MISVLALDLPTGPKVFVLQQTKDKLAVDNLPPRSSHGHENVILTFRALTEFIPLSFRVNQP